MWNFIATWVVSAIVSMALAPRPRLTNQMPGQIGDRDLPIAGAGSRIPVVFGTRVLSQPNVVWWGDVETYPITETVRSGFRKSTVTVGYWYGLAMHMALCHQADAITEVTVGDRQAWTGDLTTNTTITISKRDLWGGEKREGGLDGSLSVMFGAQNQSANSYLAGKFGAADTPAFRGVTSVLWKGLIGTQPYPKPWRFRVRRIPGGWYSAKARIGDDANPAHVIRECLTDATWGAGWPASDIDDASFITAADALYAEGFGVSLVWSQQMPVEEFVSSILKHIDATLFVDPRSGKWTIRLIRSDYAAPSLRIIDPSNAIEVIDFSRPVLGDLINEITLTYRNGATDQDAAITVQDIAMIAAQSGTVSQSVTMPGISAGTIAARVAQRELRQLGAPLARCTVVANRAASDMTPGQPFRLQWPAWGIADMVMRVVRIAYGDTGDSRVRIEAVQDVFGLPTALYAAPPPSGWTPANNPPAPCPAQALIECPYWLLAAGAAASWPSVLSDVAPNEGVIAAIGAAPSGDAFDFGLWMMEGSTWVEAGRGMFSPTGTLSAAVPLAASDVTVTLASAKGMYAVNAGDIALIDAELFVVVSVNAASGQITLARGAVDTVPVAHAAGSVLWVLRPGYVQPEYAVGQTAQIRLTPRTSLGELPVTSASTISVGVSGRAVRPYPPGGVLINGQPYPATVSADITIGWSRRNRLTQTATAPVTATGDVAPETGQTTTVRIYGGPGLTTLRRTYTGLTGTSVTWTTADQAADGASGDSAVRIEIEASRTDSLGTYTSLQRHDITVARA